MAKSVKLQEVATSKLIPYENNAKKHGEYQIGKLKKSIQEFGFVNPCLIDKDFNLVAGHGRVMAAKELGIAKIPCVFVEGLTEAQRKAYILADNKLGELAEWDMDTVNAELVDLGDMGFDVEITGFDIPKDWFSDRERWDNSREENNEEYNEFLEKFEQAKTTDDCYTPDNIYEVISEYVERKYSIDRKRFVRPFYPGGDYQGMNYKDDDVVVDNPPFSILAEIVDFYVGSGRKFFLFSPSVSTMGYTNRKDVVAICAGGAITYENGAKVVTSFLTNLDSEDIAAKSDPELFKSIEEANKENEARIHKSVPNYEYPMEVVTSAMLMHLSKYGQNLTIRRKDSVFIRWLDSQKDSGSAIYGGGRLLSEKAAAEKAAATTWQLSEREREIVRCLG